METSEARTLDSSNLQPEPTSLSRSELIFLLTLACVQFTHIMDFMIMMPLNPQLTRAFAITPKQFGFVVSSYTFAAGISGFFSAFIIDRFDRKSALLFAYAGFAIGTIACAFAPTYELLMTARALAGAFGGVLGALLMSIVGDAIPLERRGRAMGIMMASFSMASVVGVPFGLALANKFNWHAPFLLVGGIAAINAALIWIRIPSMRGHLAKDNGHHSPLAILSHIASDRNQLTALALTVCLMMSHFSLIPYISAYLVSNVGFKESELPYMYFVGGILTIFTSPFIGRLADKFGKTQIFTLMAVLILLPYWLLSHMGPTSVPLALCVTSLFFVFGNGRFVPSMAMVTSTVKPQWRGSFMSINSSVQSIASGAASTMAGLIVQKSASGPLENFNVVGYVAIAIGVLAIFVGRKLKAVDAKS